MFDNYHKVFRMSICRAARLTAEETSFKAGAENSGQWAVCSMQNTAANSQGKQTSLEGNETVNSMRARPRFFEG